MNSQNTNNMMQSLQSHYRLSAYSWVILALFIIADIIFYFLDMQNIWLLRSLLFCFLVGGLLLLIKGMPLIKTLRKSRLSLINEPDDYLREVARKSYKLTFHVIILFLIFPILMEVKLPVWVFSEIGLSLMSLTFGSSYLYLSHEKDEEETEEGE